MKILISIPFGAIKRIYSGLQANAIQIFQFLSVRLKEEEKAIACQSVYLFQFLSVRLKVLQTYILLDLEANFNSFRCD